MIDALTPNGLRATIRAADPWVTESSSRFEAALVLLAATAVGDGDARRLSELTDVPLARVRRYADRLRANGVWTADGKPASGWTGPHDEFAFWFDVNVALGLFTHPRPNP